MSDELMKMKIEKSKKKLAKGILFSLLMVSIMLVMPVCAEDNLEQQNIIGVTVANPIEVDVDAIVAKFDPTKVSDGVRIKDMSAYLSYWNKKMEWSLTEDQIQKYSQIIETTQISSVDKDTGEYVIDNMKKFNHEMGELIGLSSKEIESFISKQNEEMMLDFLSAQKTSGRDFGTSTAKAYVSPSSRSAPHATGKMVYAFIFVNFQTPSSDGHWTTAHINDAVNDGVVGVDAIRSQAPTSANAYSSVVYYQPVTVTGSNTGDNVNAWGVNGWMEKAVYALGYRNTNSDMRVTDELTRSLKSTYGADSVMLAFLTHDDKGAYALGQDQGFADRFAVSYWWVGSNLFGQPTRYDSKHVAYQHEALHEYGALDEYVGSSSYVGQMSILAVSPMRDMYSNTNHENSSSHVCSVMCTAMNNIFPNTGISTSSKKFIGWGDYDNDGVLDPFDSTPYG